MFVRYLTIRHTLNTILGHYNDLLCVLRDIINSFGVNKCLTYIAIGLYLVLNLNKRKKYPHKYCCKIGLNKNREEIEIR